LVPAAGLLLTATHTHHAPSTIDILGGQRDGGFCQRLQAALVEAVQRACDALAPAELWFAASQEASVGSNSRYLLRDGSIAWFNQRWDEVVRPTGPFDPDLPVLQLRSPGGEVVAVLFNHANHNIGALTKGQLSPGFYGLAAQEIEQRQGGVAAFLPGAFGSSHNATVFGATPHPLALEAGEAMARVVTAVEEGLQAAEPLNEPRLVALKQPFGYRLRTFDEAAEAAAVRTWAARYDPERAAHHEAVFGGMRAELANHQGEERQAWLQVLRLGEVALVGVPCELFGRLGLEIRRRSPFRYTYVVGLANGTVGYVGDRDAYRLGGYQLWAGWHSPAEPGTGEALVEQALAMLWAVAASPDR
ncbi:MAG: hypothetical protein HUU35_20095, partial [Armatimonadetes bacterium]|nr:hypothetical protein [Armatimonadota bacterium]